MKTKLDRNGEWKVAKLRLDSIRLDGGTQTRARIDDATVAEYAEAMLRSDRFPPVVVFRNDGDRPLPPRPSLLVDGFHRVKAARRAKLKHILAEVRLGGRRDALRFALGANHKHGLRRSNADKRRAVEIALTEFANLSDHFISDMCGVCQSFVSNLRHQLNSVFSSARRLGRDGKIRALPSGANGKKGLQTGSCGVASSENGHDAFIEVGEALASLEILVVRVVKQHPDIRAAVRVAISKVRADLLHLEKRVAAAEPSRSKTTG